MLDLEYAADRAFEELKFAVRTSDPHLRKAHLQSADYYSAQLTEAKRLIVTGRFGIKHKAVKYRVAQEKQFAHVSDRSREMSERNA